MNIFEDTGKIKTVAMVVPAIIVFCSVTYSLASYEAPVYTMPDQQMNQSARTEESADATKPSGSSDSASGLGFSVTEAASTPARSNTTAASSAGSSAPAEKIEEPANGYNDGEYTGTGNGYKGQVTVKVTISGGKIASIEVVSHSDDESFMNNAKSLLTTMVNNNSTNVDTVSGATFSSNGLISAVRNALSKAAKEGSPEAEQANTPVDNNTETPADQNNTSNEDEQPAVVDTLDLAELVVDAGLYKEIDYTPASYAVLRARIEDARAVLDKNDEDITQTEVDNALVNLRRAIRALKSINGDDDTDSGLYNDGTYTVTVDCNPDANNHFRAYKLTFEITIEGDEITNIKNVSTGIEATNDGFINRALNGAGPIRGMISQILSNGNADSVDAVSGATCTSVSVKKACEEAFNAARK